MRGGPDRRALLPRVRDLFLLLVVLVLVAQGIEWLDAGTALWPHRTVAAICMAGAVAWAVALHRRERSHALLDLALLAIIVGTGWGLGRAGAVIALVVGVTQLRALYGDRRSVAVVTGGVVAAYALLTALTTEPPAVLELALLTFAIGLGALVLVIRLVGEAMASHDLAAAWDGNLTAAAEELVGATEPEQIDEIVQRALSSLEQSASAAGGGLWPRPVPPGAVPATSAQLADAVVDATSGRVAPRLALVLRRLDGDRRLARERVDSERRFRVLAEESREAIYVLELRPTVAWRYLNPTAQRLLGVSDRAAQADPDAVFDRIHPDDRAALLRAGGDDWVLEDPVRFRVVREHDRKVTWVEVRETVLERVDGQARIVQGVGRDVTRQWEEEIALRRALQQQETAAEELREVDEMKSMFLQAVSHELRTPLTAVLGAAATLSSHPELADHHRSALLDSIHRQSRRLERLLEDLLNVDRLSRGIVEAERAPTDLVGLVHRVVAAMDEREHPVTVAGDAVTVDVDAAKVERIVDNLVRNAGRHTPAGTRILVEVCRDARGAVLSVEDDGPGVPAELRSRVFEPFAQGPDTRGTASPGTGIGLALVSKLAELHGGRAWVEEPEGGGARFVVTLPDGRPGAHDGTLPAGGTHPGTRTASLAPPSGLR